jgi:hypothetical protein
MLLAIGSGKRLWAKAAGYPLGAGALRPRLKLVGYRA